MKIVIIGGGIAGLSTYLHLRKHIPSWESHSVKIFERHSVQGEQSASTDVSDKEGNKQTDRLVIGGALGLAPNGLRVLRQLSQSLHARILSEGFPSRSFQFRSASNATIGSWSSDSKVPTDEPCLMISWLQIWQALRDEVIEQGGCLNGSSKVSSVICNGVIEFEDGSQDSADIIVGADGARSGCRESVLGADEGDFSAEFQGLLNFGGFVESESLPTVPDAIAETVMTFGSTGFFGYSPCTPVKISPDPHSSIASNKTMWWSTYVHSSSACPIPNSDEATKKLKQLHGGWKNPTIQHIINNCKPELSTPTWVVPSLPRWGKGRMILVGDAAHALPSTSGQGVSMVLEDAVTLATLLETALVQTNAGSDKSQNRDVNTSALDPQQLERVFQNFTALRKPRVERIRKEALQMQGKKKQMSKWECWMVYFFVWAGTKLTAKDKDSWKLDYDAKAEVDRFVEGNR